MAYQKIKSGSEGKELGCCGCMEMWFLWIFNSILFLVGFAELGAGIYAMSSNSTTWTGSGFPRMAIVMGAIVACISFLGCCGAKRQKRWLLWVYAFILFWLVLAQTAGLTVCAVGSSYIKEFLSECWDKLPVDDQSKIEESYKCCSFDGNSTDATPSDHLAYTACIKDHPEWLESCWEKGHASVQKNLRSITIAAGVVLGAQILFLFMTMALINGITETSVYRKFSLAFGNPNVGV